MTTVFTPTPNQKLASTSDYIYALEYVAPGLVVILDNLASYNQAWFDTLLQNLYAINSTAEQQTILMGLAERAKAGQPPPDVSELTPGADIVPKADLGKLITGVGMFVTLLKILG